MSDIEPRRNRNIPSARREEALFTVERMHLDGSSDQEIADALIDLFHLKSCPLSRVRTLRTQAKQLLLKQALAEDPVEHAKTVFSHAMAVATSDITNAIEWNEIEVDGVKLRASKDLGPSESAAIKSVKVDTTRTEDGESTKIELHMHPKTAAIGQMMKASQGHGEAEQLAWAKIEASKSAEAMRRVVAGESPLLVFLDLASIPVSESAA